MFRRHLTEKKIAAYLDHRLTTKEQARLEAHVAYCAQCKQRLQDIQQLAQALGPTMKSSLGEPMLPAHLHQRVQAQLRQERNETLLGFSFRQRLSTAGMIIIITLFAFSTWQIMNVSQFKTQSGQSITATPTSQLMTATPTVTSISLNTATAKSFEIAQPSTPTKRLTPSTDLILPTTVSPTGTMVLVQRDPTPTPTPEPSPTAAALPTPTELPSPRGLIAFSFFNAASHRQVYEIHLIESDGRNHRLLPLDGISEPALSFTNGAYRLAYRAWGFLSSPRTLISSDLTGQNQTQIGGFWEDAHPDWSPVNDQLIYASQRETDRRWRLYSNRADGQAEIDLGLIGQAPSFGPNGRRFVYQGCDPSGNRCGLWHSHLDNAALATNPILTNPNAVSPDWSPIDEKIVYMAKIEGNWDLYLIHSNGSGLWRLTTDSAVDGLPTWSPDGNWIAFLSNRGGNWGIWRIHVATGTIKRIFAFDGGIFTPPHREPYGERNWWDEQLSWAP